MKSENKLLKRFSQLKKLVQENKELYTIYSNENNELIKIVSIEPLTEDMNYKTLIKVTLENEVNTELRYWEITTI